MTRLHYLQQYLWDYLLFADSVGHCLHFHQQADDPCLYHSLDFHLRQQKYLWLKRRIMIWKKHGDDFRHVLVKEQLFCRIAKLYSNVIPFPYWVSKPFSFGESAPIFREELRLSRTDFFKAEFNISNPVNITNAAANSDSFM